MTPLSVGMILAFAVQDAVSRDDQTAQHERRVFGWTSKSADIEWVEARSIGSRTVALIATDAHDLVVADLGQLETDNPLLQLRAGPGLRFAVHGRDDALEATATQHRFYCFDRYTVFAIDVGGAAGARVAWRRGDWPAGVAAIAPGGDDGPAFQGDPESLATIIAAAAVEEGVIIARSDGRVLMSSAASGEPMWEMSRPPLAVVEFSVAGPDELVMLWKEGGDVQVAFVLERAPGGRTDLWQLGTGWPIWWRAVPGGLVAVWPNEAVFLRSNGDRRAIAPQPALTHFGAALVDVFIPPWLPTREKEWPNDALLVAMDERGAGAAFRAANGKLVWRTVTVPMPPPILDFVPRSLRIRGRHFVAADSRGVAAFSCEDGAFQLGEATPGPLIAATALAGALKYIYAVPAVVTPSTDAGRLRVRTIGRSANGIEPLCREVRIDGLTTLRADELRDVQWVGQTLVLVSKREIQSIPLKSLDD